MTPWVGVVGAYVVSRWVPPRLHRRLIGPLAVLAASGPIVCVVRPGFVASILLFVVSGGLGTVVVMLATTSFMAAVPDGSRGQVLGLSNSGLTTASGLSPLLAGVLADHLGAARTVGWFGLAGTVMAVPLAVSWRRITREAPRRWGT